MNNLAVEARRWILKSITAAGSGHPGGSLSLVEILLAFYGGVLKHDPKNPKDPNRDRLILSKGHGAPALYAVLGLHGYYPVEEIMTLRQLGSRFQGHPDIRFFPLAEASTGSLGQGISLGIGMATSARLDGRPYHTCVILGDGECQEGQIWESAMYAGFHKIANLTALVDINGFQLDDATRKILDMEPWAAKFQAFGWRTYDCDGHDIGAVTQALLAARDDGAPSVVLARTVKGKGVSHTEGNNEYHGKALTPAQLEEALKELEAAHA
jgi:transketolase